MAYPLLSGVSKLTTVPEPWRGMLSFLICSLIQYHPLTSLGLRKTFFPIRRNQGFKFGVMLPWLVIHQQGSTFSGAPWAHRTAPVFIAPLANMIHLGSLSTTVRGDVCEMSATHWVMELNLLSSFKNF